MGLRFRKSVNLGGGVRLNFNKKSVGLSVGTKGARYSVNSNGRKTASVCIPGTGLYWTESKGGEKKGSNNGGGLGCSGWILFSPFILIYYMLKYMFVFFVYIFKWSVVLVKKIIEILKGDDEKKKKIVYIGLAIFGVIFLLSFIETITSHEPQQNNSVNENVNMPIKEDKEASKNENQIEEDETVENDKTIEDEKQKETNIEKKKYKINSDEYGNYLNNTVKTIMDGNTIFETWKTDYYNPYAKVFLYSKKEIDIENFKKEYKILLKKYYNEFVKNEYEKGGALSANYEYINIYFYNYSYNKSDEQGFFQIKILEINNYKNFDDFYTNGFKTEP